MIDQSQGENTLLEGGHGAAGLIVDIAADPFDTQRLVSVADDGSVCVWKITQPLGYVSAEY